MAAVNERATRFKKVVRVLEQYEHDPAKLIPILQAVQEEYRYLPEEVMTYVATALGISPAKVFGVATFYSHFSLEPKGRTIIKVCDDTACHVKGSGRLVDHLRSKLGVTAKQRTTSDFRFTVETVSCLGACGLAPVMVVDEQVYGQVDAARADEIIAALESEQAAAASAVTTDSSTEAEA
ncbi:MAG: NADH-quinone oxidoreductase subunit NuoE [Spirochaetota bacterium]